MHWQVPLLDGIEDLEVVVVGIGVVVVGVEAAVVLVDVDEMKLAVVGVDWEKVPDGTPVAKKRFGQCNCF